MSVLWLGLDTADGTADERLVEHDVLRLLDGVGVEADLVCTHVVDVDGRPRVSASARLVGGGSAWEHSGPAARLHGAWSGALVLEGDQDALGAGARGGREAARRAVSQARDGLSGRVVRFPGEDALVAPLPVRDAISRSSLTAVEAVVGDLTDDTLLDPGGHVRPQLRDGALVLLVRPGPAGTVVPVEKADAHACAGH